MFDFYVGLDAKAVVDSASVAGGECGLERIGHFDGTTILVTMLIVDGLDATTTRNEILGHGNLHLAVVGHWHNILYQPFSK